MTRKIHTTRSAHEFMATLVGGSCWGSYEDVGRIILAGKGEFSFNNSTYRVEDGDLHWSNVWGQSRSESAVYCLDYMRWGCKATLAKLEAERAA